MAQLQTMQNDLRFAVLIDADNVPSVNVKGIMEEIAKYGTPTFKRIYGDWTKPHVSGWKNVLLENAITPIQQYSYTTGKNATDSAMIIDAMDILYSGRVDGFCIVSSDSDFTRLALRLREAGMKVIGMGQKKTPAPFIVACDKFIYLEILSQRPSEHIKEEGKKEEEVHVNESIKQMDKVTIKLIATSI
ncbi:MAG TPA: NYN domain-containing protein, partial [Flavipsychrobacter sp.]|nr:NYN domain-containing protein [Flavipsychrobacter sp.]